MFIKSCVLVWKRVFERKRVISQTCDFQKRVFDKTCVLKTYNLKSSCVYQIVCFKLKTCVWQKRVFAKTCDLQKRVFDKTCVSKTYNLKSSTRTEELRVVHFKWTTVACSSLRVRWIYMKLTSHMLTMNKWTTCSSLCISELHMYRTRCNFVLRS